MQNLQNQSNFVKNLTLYQPFKSNQLIHTQTSLLNQAITPSLWSSSAFRIKKDSVNSTVPIKRNYIHLNQLKGSVDKTLNSENTQEQTGIKREVRKKLNLSNNQQQKLNNALDFDYLLNILSGPETEQKQQVFEEIIAFPNYSLKKLVPSSNQLLSRTIEIISNKNQKISIPIHQGLYKSNTCHSSQPSIPIPNLINFQLKNNYTQSLEFIRDYKSGYAPIQMQLQSQQTDAQVTNQTSPIKSNKDKSRSHFIRKQQSTLNLPRTCGVSYIKESESNNTQLEPFKPLPPLIFQGSSSCALGHQVEVLNQQQAGMVSRFVQQIQQAWLGFILVDQSEMRDTLLNKRTSSAQVGWVQGFQNLWPLFIQGTFILVLASDRFLATEEQVWEAFLSKNIYFKIGVLSKRSTSGAKAFLKSIKANSIQSSVSRIPQATSYNSLINLQHSPQQQKKISPIQTIFSSLQNQLMGQKTIITTSIRLQMYVQQSQWKQIFTFDEKKILNQIIIGLKNTIEAKSINIIKQRIQLAKNNVQGFQNTYDRLRIMRDSKNHFISNHILRQKEVSFTQKSIHHFQCEPTKQFIKNSKLCSPIDFIKKSAEQLWKKTLKFPIYYISTRDSFAFDLIQKKTLMKCGQRQYTKIEYLFYPDNVPTNYGPQFRKMFPHLDVGITSYHDFFTNQQLKGYEGEIFEMEQKAFKNKFLQMTVQPSIVSTKIKRTKFFFGYRYMWTRPQLSQPASYVGAGVRKDVTLAPSWTKQIQKKMVAHNLVQPNFLNSVAVNVYHDGKQGLAQHFDDAVRFKQPIYTIRLFSDARLSFGSQFYGFCNGAFIIPLPRGCICVMEENSYAANGVKHCVRPCDMMGKSAAVILRQMHQQVVAEAAKYDQFVDFPAWLSSISNSQNSITYAQQKRLQSEFLMKQKCQ